MSPEQKYEQERRAEILAAKIRLLLLENDASLGGFGYHPVTLTVGSAVVRL